MKMMRGEEKKTEYINWSIAISTTGLLPLQYILPSFSALSINLINYTFTIIKLQILFPLKKTLTNKYTTY